MRQANAYMKGSSEASGHSPAEGPGREAIETRRALYDMASRIGYTRLQLFWCSPHRIAPAFHRISHQLPTEYGNILLIPAPLHRDVYDRLGDAVEGRAVLSKLQEVTFFGDLEWWLKKAEAILLLPSLRKLALIDTAIDSTSDLFCHRNRQNCSITDLTIGPSLTSRKAQIWLSDCLQVPKSLVSLKLHLPHRTDLSPPDMFPNDRLWDSLSAHRHTLQHLDIYRSDSKHILNRA